MVAGTKSRERKYHDLVAKKDLGRKQEAIILLIGITLKRSSKKVAGKNSGKNMANGVESNNTEGFSYCSFSKPWLITV